MSTNISPWQHSDWLKSVHYWIGTELARENIQVFGEIEQIHIRPWSTVMRVATSSGLFFFKASASYFGYETGLTGYLALTYPDVFPQIYGLDLKRNWLLMRDSGVPLRSFIKADGRIDHWQKVLPLYVGLQKSISDKQQILFQLGVPDRRLSQLPGLFDELLWDEPAMLLGKAEGLQPEEYLRLKNAGREFGDLCNRLAEAGIPESLQHDDFHDANIFLQNGRVIFTDWGECAVAHPFFSLVVILRSVENSLDLSPDADEIETLRGWYLDLWGEYGTTTELRVAASLAERIGYVNRALTWHTLISQLPEELKHQYAQAVPAYLREYLNAG
jgi:hypothetical protein